MKRLMMAVLAVLVCAGLAVAATPGERFEAAKTAAERTAIAQEGVDAYAGGAKPAEVTTRMEGVLRQWEAQIIAKTGDKDGAVALLLGIPENLRDITAETNILTLTGTKAGARAALARAEKTYGDMEQRRQWAHTADLAFIYGVYGHLLDLTAAETETALLRLARLSSRTRLVDGMPVVEVQTRVLPYLSRLYVRLAGLATAKEVGKVNDTLFEILPLTDDTKPFLTFLADQKKTIVPTE
jgi:hypothetical protein